MLAECRLYQMWSRCRLLDPDPAATMFCGQQSMLDRMNSGTTPQTMAVALSAVVDADKWEMDGQYEL